MVPKMEEIRNEYSSFFSGCLFLYIGITHRNKVIKVESSIAIFELFFGHNIMYYVIWMAVTKFLQFWAHMSRLWYMVYIQNTDKAVLFMKCLAWIQTISRLIKFDKPISSHAHLVYFTRMPDTVLDYITALQFLIQGISVLIQLIFRTI